MGFNGMQIITISCSHRKIRKNKVFQFFQIHRVDGLMENLEKLKNFVFTNFPVAATYGNDLHTIEPHRYHRNS
jgi:hypothetical protein